MDARDYRLGIGDEALPRWVPEAARHYLAHTETGQPIRALARQKSCHASTILRQVRRFENRRDDPLVDAALKQLSGLMSGRQGTERKMMEVSHKGARAAAPAALPSEARIEEEGARVLRRLCEPGAVLAVARDMDMAVVVRSGPDGASMRTASVDAMIAQALALKEWIACEDPLARIARYRITGPGRAELRRLVTSKAGQAQEGRGCADISAEIVHHRKEAEADLALRSNLGESPLAGLARRRDRDGKPFLSRDLVSAGERLREDFELAQMGPKVAQDWDRFLTAGTASSQSGRREGSSAAAARDRVAAALADLGPGLGDVVLRCCCYLEGMERTERRMGWSARSGKIVLRIALQRLKRHYDAQGRFAPRIG